ncbi:MAG: hypothetical protein WCJ33_01155, partial [Pseudomonadota bacterium]
PLISAIAVTRVALNHHTELEVFVGFLVGCVTIFIIHIFLQLGSRIKKFNVSALLLFLLIIAALLHGYRLPAEDLLHYLASLVRNKVSVCSKTHASL